MSKPANKTLIGAFVVGAVALAVAAIVLFGSGKFFRKTELWLTFFEGSVKGLNVGSPVVFRGVQIGEVTDIIVGFDPAKLEVLIPVFFEVDPKKFQDIGGGQETGDRDMHEALISRGLRVQLQMQSLVTGQLLVNVDFYPDTPANIIGMERFKDTIELREWWEIPSVPTPLQELEKALSGLNIKEITEDVRKAMDGIAKLANSPELHEGIIVIKDTLKDVQKLARNLDSKLEPLATRIDQTLVEARAGIGDARKLMKEQAPVLISELKKSAKAATTALDHANETLKSIENVAEEGTQLRHEVSATLTEIAAASRSVRVLADFIEQHPDALLRGRVTRTGGN
jgi:paraquat-inducible protein B